MSVGIIESLDGAASFALPMDPLAERRHAAERRGGRRRSVDGPRVDARDGAQPRRTGRSHPPTTFDLDHVRQEIGPQTRPTGENQPPKLFI